MSGQDPFTEALRDWAETSMDRSMRAFIRYTRKSALSFSQINTLFRLYHHGPCPVNDIADHLGVTIAAVSQLLASLEASGLVERSKDPHDRRIKQVALTDQGSTRVHESMDAKHAWIDELAALMQPEERDALLPALSSLNAYAHKLKEQIHTHGGHPCSATPKQP